MLVLTRRIGEEIVIADEIRIKVVSVRGDRVRIGIDAPPDICVERLEVHTRRVAGAIQDDGAPSPELVAGAAAIDS
jgi:carbon storage regulator